MSIEVRVRRRSTQTWQRLSARRSPSPNVCFCLCYRIGNKENVALRGETGAERVRELCAPDPPPGVIAFLDDEPLGWAALYPRTVTSFARNRLIPHVDDLDVWAL